MNARCVKCSTYYDIRARRGVNLGDFRCMHDGGRLEYLSFVQDSNVKQLKNSDGQKFEWKDDHLMNGRTSLIQLLTKYQDDKPKEGTGSVNPTVTMHNDFADRIGRDLKR